MRVLIISELNDDLEGKATLVTPSLNLCHYRLYCCRLVPSAALVVAAWVDYGYSETASFSRRKYKCPTIKRQCEYKCHCNPPFVGSVRETDLANQQEVFVLSQVMNQNRWEALFME